MSPQPPAAPFSLEGMRRFNVYLQMGHWIRFVKDECQSPLSAMRQNLQWEYTNRLVGIAKSAGGRLPAAQAVDLYELKRVEKFLSEDAGRSRENEPHRQLLLHLIKGFMNEGRPAA